MKDDDSKRPPDPPAPLPKIMLKEGVGTFPKPEKPTPPKGRIIREGDTKAWGKHHKQVLYDDSKPTTSAYSADPSSYRIDPAILHMTYNFDQNTLFNFDLPTKKADTPPKEPLKWIDGGSNTRWEDQQKLALTPKYNSVEGNIQMNENNHVERYTVRSTLREEDERVTGKCVDENTKTFSPKFSPEEHARLDAEARDDLYWDAIKSAEKAEKASRMFVGDGEQTQFDVAAYKDKAFNFMYNSMFVDIKKYTIEEARNDITSLLTEFDEVYDEKMSPEDSLLLDAIKVRLSVYEDIFNCQSIVKRLKG